ncbi:gamma-glutamyltransferase [Salipaludibacillus aurantiacus]|uniref:Gamma-glutamyltranspeptidase / glutathione hydrolase n=1 Tax=Salipaludibacillus aurantiacus TaxID=1601833 RepID=A0A1H9VFA7_9BACI|nr:gamma-glutamyltransferase [Salipaludibacillus aurantiacus]SES20154.1 gamma-glutamyltranspeptidase / glutathione hydrolase [Salipaludibacillus aurantiacus]
MRLRKLTNVIGIPLIIIFVVMAYIEVSPAQEIDEIVRDDTFTGVDADTGYIVSAANPYAVDAGTAVLENGGNAIDAALAVSFTLGVVEPYGSGIGGGGSMLIYDPTANEEDKISYIDYRETAPLALPNEQRGQTPHNLTAGMADFGVPGFLKGMDYLHRNYATMPLDELLQQAILLADNGFEVDKYLAERFYYAQNRLNPADIPHYFPENNFIQQGNTLVQKELAETLQEIAAKDSLESYFLNEFATDMAARFPLLSEEDFRQYEVLTDQKPATGQFDEYTVHAAPAPLGGPVFIQALQMAELMNVDDHEIFRLPEGVNVADRDAYTDVEKPAEDDTLEITEAERQEQLRKTDSYIGFIEKMIGINYETYRDRLRNIGDPHTSEEARQKLAEAVTWEKSSELVNNWYEYLDKREHQRRFEEGGEEDFLEDGTESYLPPVYVKKGMMAGKAAGKHASQPLEAAALADMPAQQSERAQGTAESFFDAEAEINQHNNTTHFVIIDKEGRMVSATHTLSNFFGSGQYYKGFFLNDQLSNFSETPGSINEPYPGRRPRSFMSPAILVKENGGKVEELIGLGSPGGARIPMMMAQIMVFYSMYEMDFEEAMTYMTRFQYDFNDEAGEYEIRLEPKFRELEGYADIREGLKERGYPVTLEFGQMYFGGIQAAVYDAATQELYGYADPRRGGKAGGADENEAGAAGEPAEIMRGTDAAAGP